MVRRLPGSRQRQAASWPDYLARRRQAAGDERLERFFAAGTVRPETPILETSLVALDVETTGLDPRHHDLVSIGLVPFTLERIHLSARRYWVVAPRRALSETSITFHHITHSEIADAPDFAAIIEELLACLAGRLVVVHYRHIERPFLDAALHERLGEHWLFPMIDTMSLEARRHRRRRWVWLRRAVGLTPASIRLHESRQRYHLPAYQGHHALVDALATAELFQAQVAGHFSAQTPVSTFWT